MLCIAISWEQAKAGIRQPLWIDVIIPFSSCNLTWTLSIRISLCQISGTIKSAKNEVPSQQRTRDPYLLENIANNPVYSTQDKKLINFCWFYLQAVTLANISNVTGICVRTAMLMCNYLPSNVDKNVHMFTVNQVKPGLKALHLMA